MIHLWRTFRGNAWLSRLYEYERRQRRAQGYIIHKLNERILDLEDELNRYKEAGYEL